MPSSNGSAFWRKKMGSGRRRRLPAPSGHFAFGWLQLLIALIGSVSLIIKQKNWQWKCVICVGRLLASQPGETVKPSGSDNARQGRPNSEAVRGEAYAVYSIQMEEIHVTPVYSPSPMNISNIPQLPYSLRQREEGKAQAQRKRQWLSVLSIPSKYVTDDYWLEALSYVAVSCCVLLMVAVSNDKYIDVLFNLQLLYYYGWLSAVDLQQPDDMTFLNIMSREQNSERLIDLALLCMVMMPLWKTTPNIINPSNWRNTYYSSQLSEEGEERLRSYDYANVTLLKHYYSVYVYSPSYL